MNSLSQGRSGIFIKSAAYTLMLAGILAIPKAFSTTTLSADGPGNTYELIQSHNLGLETPDCGHSVRHIREVYDGDLDKHVFAFDSHRDLDDDRCSKFDRQRIEIKTAPPGNAEMQAGYGDTAYYRWKFKLPAGFQPSPNFTHIHQIKTYGGSDAGAPILTITPRAGSPDKMQIIYTAPSGQAGSGVKSEVGLSPFVDTWVEAFVKYRSHDSGFIEVSIKRLSDGTELLSWNSGNIDTWRSGTTYNRGKWGVYRSLNSPSYLRDETVLFADWCFSESGEADCPSDVGNDAGGSGATLTLQENSVGFCSVDGAIESDHAGYSGSGYANTINENESAVEWSVVVPQAGLYTLQWRFANGASDRPANVLINGGQAAGVTMAATGAWTSYADSSQVEVGLNSGYNTILLQASGSSGLANIDNISINGADPQAGDCNGGGSSGGDTPVARHGQLHVCGTQLCNQNNQPVQLRGMSTHGLQWYGWGQCVTEGSLDALSNDWRADILRVSLYVQEGGYETDPAGYTVQVSQIIDEVTERGMYVLVDWHQLDPGDPNYNLDNARQFFTDIARTHADKDNIIYDVANEPNNASWDAIQSYAMQIIPMIRQYAPDAVVLVGTHGWASLGVSDGRSAQDIIDNPVTIDNTMYTFHFYAASHGQEYRDELKWALDRGLPVFVTEWGSQTYTGDGGNDFTSTQAYLDLLDQYQVSWTNWNYSDDFRSGAVWKTGTCSSGSWTKSNLKEAGQWVRDKIRNR